jgi:hypothetical protein
VASVRKQTYKQATLRRRARSELEPTRHGGVGASAERHMLG